MVKTSDIDFDIGRIAQIFLGVVILLLAGMEFVSLMLIAVAGQFLMTQHFGDITPLFTAIAILKIGLMVYFGTFWIVRASIGNGFC